MAEREHWTDGMLNERFMRLDERHEDIIEAIAALRQIPDGVARALTQTEERIERRIDGTDRRCEQISSDWAAFRKEYHEDRERTARARGERVLALLVACCGAIGVIVAALINAHVL